MMLLQQELDQLKQFNGKQNDQKVFSLYLDTRPEQGEKWKIELKNALQDLAKRTKNSNNHEEKNQSKDIIKKVEKRLQDLEPDFKNGVLLFITSYESLWFEQLVNVPIETEFNWGDTPKLDQLKSLTERYPYTGIVVLQQDKARVIETEIGIAIGEYDYTLDLDTNDWRQHQGPQGDDYTQRGAKRDEFKARVKANQERWLKSLTSIVEKTSKKNGWQQLYLAGEKEEVEKLRSMFNVEIDKVTPSNILKSNTTEIIKKVMET